MKNLALYLFLATTLLLACNDSNSGDTQAGTDNPVTQAWDQMMVIHDEVMPEISTLKKLEQGFRAMPKDSITNRTLASLNKAEKAMWDWMHNLTPLDQVNKMPEAEAMNYIKKKTEEISEVKQIMLAAIKTGQEQAATKSE